MREILSAATNFGGASRPWSFAWQKRPLAFLRVCTRFAALTSLRRADTFARMHHPQRHRFEPVAAKPSSGYTFYHCISTQGRPMQVSKWGNSLAIRLPASVVEALGLKEGDQIELHVAGKRALDVSKTPGARELLARLRKFRGRLPKDFKFDRLEANERK